MTPQKRQRIPTKGLNGKEEYAQGEVYIGLLQTGRVSEKILSIIHFHSENPASVF